MLEFDQLHFVVLQGTEFAIKREPISGVASYRARGPRRLCNMLVITHRASISEWGTECFETTMYAASRDSNHIF